MIQSKKGKLEGLQRMCVHIEIETYFICLNINPMVKVCVMSELSKSVSGVGEGLKLSYVKSNG